MLLSILICVHSQDDLHDKLLLQALSSLDIQTYKDFDVYIVFDECWEQTNNIVHDNYKFLIRRLYHPKKQGLSEAKNYGLSFINSEYVGFLDADDAYVYNKLQKQMTFLFNNNIDFLSTLAWCRYLNTPTLFESCIKTGLYETHQQIINILPQENVLTHGSMIARKSAIDYLGGYRNVKGMEDWDLWLRAKDAGFIFHQLQERLYIYTMDTSVAR
jgi:glycosyltransferase involved in cell wall biosynthesis